MSRVRVAVLGGGLMGLRHARVLWGMPGAELAAVVDRCAEARDRARAAFGVPTPASIDELPPDVQGVIVALPDDAHREASVALLERGVAVLVEKPLATTIADAEAIAAAGEGRLLMPGHILRFDPRYLEARRRVQAGTLGPLLHAYARRNSAAGAALRYGATTRLPWHVSIHDVDVLRWVAGQDVVEVHAQAVARRFATGHLDSLQALCRLGDGSTAVIESCWALPEHMAGAIDSRLEVVGRDGMLEVTGLAQGLTVADGVSVRWPDTARWAEYEDGAGGGILAAELAHFVRCVDEGRAPVVAPADAVAAVRVAAAIEDSLRAGGPVRLGQGTERGGTS